MIDIRINNQQMANYLSSILPGGYADFTFNSSGTISYRLGIGFYTSVQARDVWFVYTGTFSVIEVSR